MAATAASKAPPHVRVKQRVGHYLRRRRKLRDNPEVRQARHLVQRLAAGPLDVLHLGASESLYTADYDEDKRTFPQMIAAELPDGLSMHSIAGAGYNPGLYNAYLDVAAAQGARPLVIVGFCIRFGDAAWARHPDYGFRRPRAALQAIDPAAPAKRFTAAIAPPSPAEYDELDTIVHPTLIGTKTVGEFRSALKDPVAHGLSPDDAIRLKLAYHFGCTNDLEAAFLADITALGARLRELELPVVCYHMPVPIDQVCAVIGDQARPDVLRRFAAVDAAFRAGYGEIDIIQSSLEVSTEDFIDPNAGVEHLNAGGRMRMVQLVVDGVARR